MSVLLSPGPAAAQNSYGGFDIAGDGSVRESNYSSVRGWNVVSAVKGGRFAYCAGEFNDGGGVWRLGRDLLTDGSHQWQIAFPFPSQPHWEARLEIDGDARAASHEAGRDWTFLWLGLPELDRIRNGNEMIVSLDKHDIQRRLSGTAAVITKIEECVQRRGKGGTGGSAVIAAPKPAPGPGGGQKSQAPAASQSAVAGGAYVAPVAATGCESPSDWTHYDGDPTTVTFRYDLASDRATQIYWVDPTGAFVSMGIFDRVSPVLSLDTFVGHMFVVRDSDGTCLSWFQIEPVGHNDITVQ
jgi:hypothetical protein